MPRESRVSEADRREWLAAWERGARIDKIAKEARRNERTVSAQVERARQEREQHEVHAGLLKDAYKKHYIELLGVVEEIKRAAERPVPGSLSPDRRGASARAQDAPSPSDGTVYKFRSEILEAALRQHVPRSPLWPACRRWEDAAYARNFQMEEVGQTATEWVDQQVRPRFPEVAAETFVENLCLAATRTAEGAGFSELKYVPSESNAGFALHWAGLLLANNLPTQTKLDELQELHRQLIRKLIGSQLVARLKSAYEEWAGARDAIWREAEVLLLRGMLPGLCELCPGSESKKRRKPRTQKESRK